MGNANVVATFIFAILVMGDMILEASILSRKSSRCLKTSIFIKAVRSSVFEMSFYVFPISFFSAVLIRYDRLSSRKFCSYPLTHTLVVR